MKKFITGSLFVLLLIPIVDCLITILQQLSQHVCTVIAKHTYDIKKGIEDCECGGNGMAIGFQMPDEELEYEEDADE